MKEIIIEGKKIEVSDESFKELKKSLIKEDFKTEFVSMHLKKYKEDNSISLRYGDSKYKDNFGLVNIDFDEKEIYFYMCSEGFSDNGWTIKSNEGEYNVVTE